MTEQENMAALTAQVHQLTQWAGDPQQRFAAQQQQQQKFLTGKEVRIENFEGNGEHNRSRNCHAERGDPESHRNRGGTARVGNAFEAQRTDTTRTH